MKNIIKNHLPEDLADIVVSNIYDTVVVGSCNYHHREGGHIKSSFGIAIRIFTLREAIKHLSEDYYYEPHIWPVEKELTSRKKLYNSTVRGYVGESVDEAIIGKAVDVYSDPILIDMLVESNGMNIKHVPKGFITGELAMKAVKNSNSNNVLQYVPERLRTLEICQLALQKNHFSLVNFPKSLPVEFWTEVVKKYPWAIKYVWGITDEMVEDAISKNGSLIKYLPRKYWTLEWFKKAAKTSAECLGVMPKEFRTQEFATYAVMANSECITAIPKRFRTAELCAKAMKDYGYALLSVPKEILTEEICYDAVSNYGMALMYVPDKFRTDRVIRSALANNPRARVYLKEI